MVLVGAVCTLTAPQIADIDAICISLSHPVPTRLTSGILSNFLWLVRNNHSPSLAQAGYVSGLRPCRFDSGKNSRTYYDSWVTQLRHSWRYRSNLPMTHNVLLHVAFRSPIKDTVWSTLVIPVLIWIVTLAKMLICCSLNVLIYQVKWQSSPEPRTVCWHCSACQG